MAVIDFQVQIGAVTQIVVAKVTGNSNTTAATFATTLGSTMPHTTLKATLNITG